MIQCYTPSKGTDWEVEGRFSMTTMRNTITPRKAVFDIEILSPESGGSKNAIPPIASSRMMGIPKLNT